MTRRRAPKEPELFRIPLSARLTPSQRKAVGPWHKRFLAATPTDASAMIATRWAGAPRWIVKQFSRLLRAEPTAVVLYDDVSFLELTDDDDTWFMRNPPTSASVDKKLGALGFDEDSDVTNLLCLFAGIKDQRPDYAGGFLAAKDLTTLQSARRRGIVSTDPNIELSPTWDDAVLIYQTASGDVLLVAKNNKTAWLQEETESVLATGLTLRQTFA